MQTTTQKSGDPSMEEILASIRKIIAEDPAASTPPLPKPVALPAGPGTGPVGIVAKEAPLPRPASANGLPGTSLENELADLLRDPVEVPPAARLVPVVKPPGASPAAPSKDADAAGIGAWLRGKAESGLATAGPVVAAPSVTEPGSLAAPLIKPDVPAAPSSAPVGDTAPSAPSMQTILGRLSASAAGASGTSPMPTSAKARAVPAVAKALDTDTTPPSTAPANRTMTEFTPPAATQVPEPADVAGSPAPANVTGISAALAAAQAAAPVSAQPAAIVERMPPAPTTPDAIAAAIATPAVVAAATAAVAKFPATLEETLAEMLRPMVRQWLDENMRGALEKAIRTELSGSPAKPTDKT